MPARALPRTLRALAFVASFLPRAGQAEAPALRLEDRAAWAQVAEALGREPGADDALVAWVRLRGRADAATRQRAFLEALGESPHQELYRRAAAGVGPSGDFRLRTRTPGRPVPGGLLLAQLAHTRVDRLALLGVTRHEELDWAEFRALVEGALPRGRAELEDALRTWGAPEEEVAWILLHRGVLGPRWNQQLQDPARQRAKRVLELALRTDHARLRAVLAGVLGRGPRASEVGC